MPDCLIIGHNDMVFDDYVRILKAMGTEHADYKDLCLNYIEYYGKPYRALDILTHFYFRDRQDRKVEARLFHNFDLMWMTLLYLGTYLAKRGFTFDYINLFQLEKERLREKLQKEDFLTIAITTSIYNFEEPILEVISFIKQYNRTAKIIIGGPYISKRYERMETTALATLFKYIGADFYVFDREGEQAFVNILKALKNHGDFSAVHNIAYKKGNDYVINPWSRESNPLEQNMIDYSLFPRENFGEFLNLRISKGCPYSCSFCGFPLRTKKYSYLDARFIEKELNAVRDIGTVKYIFFVDDTVNVPKKNFKEVLRMMIRQKYEFKWHCFFRCDQWDEETIALMQESGCEGVFLGLESADETLLKNMNKTARPKEYREAIPLFKKAGMLVFSSIFVGFPGETVETFRETMDFLQETGSDFYRPQLWYCEPLTPIWEQREKFGLKGYHFGWSHNTMDVKTACDLMEKALLGYDNPIWAPDPGFNFISIYYLKNRGMSTAQVKTFLKCFNAIVKEKFLFPGKKEISPQLIESLKASCRFDEPGEPDMRPVELYSGANYSEAEKFWIMEFKDFFPWKPGGETTPQMKRATWRMDTPVSNHFRLADGQDLPTFILAAFYVLMLGLKGREDIAIVVAVDGKEALPIRLKPSWGLSFRELSRALLPKLQKAIEHRLYAFHFLTNPLRMAAYGGSCPVFDVAYMVMENENDDMEQRLPYFPMVNQKLQLVLQVFENKHDVKFQFQYSTAAYRQETIEQLSLHLVSILKTAGENQEIPLENIVKNPQKEKHKRVLKEHASKNFNF